MTEMVEKVAASVAPHLCASDRHCGVHVEIARAAIAAVFDALEERTEADMANALKAADQDSELYHLEDILAFFQSAIAQVRKEALKDGL